MNSPPISPPRPRRRSSFFERRNSPQVSAKIRHQPTYAEKLEAEAAAWKRLYKNTIAKQTSLKRQLDQIDDQFQHADDSFLYELIADDVADFLRKKPDLKKVQNDAIQFCKECNTVSDIYAIYLEDNQRVTDHVQKSVQLLKEFILNNSTAEGLPLDSLCNSL